MSFAYRDGVLHAEELPLDEIARRFGTPCYVYSRQAIACAYDEFARALAGRASIICASVKANPSLVIDPGNGSTLRAKFRIVFDEDDDDGIYELSVDVSQEPPPQ